MPLSVSRVSPDHQGKMAFDTEIVKAEASGKALRHFRSVTYTKAYPPEGHDDSPVAVQPKRSYSEFWTYAGLADRVNSSHDGNSV
jgi:hypothetical protein